MAAFGWGLWIEGSLERGRTYAFAAIVVAEALRALVGRSDSRSVWAVGLLSNPRLLAAVALALGLQFASHHSNALQSFLGTGALDLATCGGLFVLGAAPAAILEVGKSIRRRRLATRSCGAGV
jgi:Ca2+-transporting ATPase